MLDANHTDLTVPERPLPNYGGPNRVTPGHGAPAPAFHRQPPTEPALDLGALVRRHLFLLLAFAVGGALLAAAIAWSLPEVYAARAKLVLERRDPALFEAVPELERGRLDREAVETEEQILGSREIAARVVDALRLTSDPWFNSHAPGRPDAAAPDGSALAGFDLAPLRARIGAWKETLLGPDAPPAPPPPASVQRENTVTTFLARTEVNRVGASLAMSVRATHRRPERAQEVANALAAQYIAAAQGARRTATEEAIGYLTQRAGRLALRIAAAERALAEHRARFALDDEEAPRRQRATLTQLRTRLALDAAGDGTGNAARTAAVREEVTRLEAELAARAGAEVELEQRERELAAARERHRLVVERLENLDLQAEPLNRPARIVSPAQVPASPVSPKRFLITAGGGFGGLLLAAVLVLFREAGDRRIRGERDLAHSPWPNLASLPELRAPWWRPGLRPDQAAARDPRSFYALSVRNLLVGCRRMAFGAPSWAVLVTSCVPNDGKTAVSSALAFMAARDGHRTVLVDLDLLKPSMGRAFGVATGAPGLREYLRGECTLDEAIVAGEGAPNGPAGVHVVLPGALRPKEADPLDDAAVAQVVAELKSRYDVVILDSPPVILFDDVGQMAQSADVALLVLRWNRTDRQTAERAMAKLAWFSDTPAATLINRVDPKARERGSEVPFDLGAYASYTG